MTKETKETKEYYIPYAFAEGPTTFLLNMSQFAKIVSLGDYGRMVVEGPPVHDKTNIFYILREDQDFCFPENSEFVGYFKGSGYLEPKRMYNYYLYKATRVWEVVKKLDTIFE